MLAMFPSIVHNMALVIFFRYMQYDRIENLMYEWKVSFGYYLS